MEFRYSDIEHQLVQALPELRSAAELTGQSKARPVKTPVRTFFLNNSSRRTSKCYFGGRPPHAATNFFIGRLPSSSKCWRVEIATYTISPSRCTKAWTRAGSNVRARSSVRAVASGCVNMIQLGQSVTWQTSTSFPRFATFTTCVLSSPTNYTARLTMCQGQPIRPVVFAKRRRRVTDAGVPVND
jgi:hypothetical protein